MKGIQQNRIISKNSRGSLLDILQEGASKYHLLKNFFFNFFFWTGGLLGAAQQAWNGALDALEA